MFVACVLFLFRGTSALHLPFTAGPTAAPATYNKYVVAPFGTNECPPGTFAMNECDCGVAAAALGMQYIPQGSTCGGCPKGCNTQHNHGVYGADGRIISGGQDTLVFNNHETGSQNELLAPVCTKRKKPTKDCKEQGEHTTAVGDPHLVNARGEHFSIFTTGALEFIRVPFDSTTANAEFAVQAIIESFGQTNDKCKDAQYITGLLFSGSKFHGKSLEVHVDKIHPGATQNEIKVLLGGIGVEPSTDPIEVGDKMTLEMPNSNELVLHVDGASVAAKLQYYFLNVEANAFSKLAPKIGGLLGEDDHAAYSMKPAGCDRKFASSAEPMIYSSARMTA